jgi:hypothetical protein
MSEERCKCGEPHDNWPGEDGGPLCQMCWESECDASWWRAVIAIDEAMHPPSEVKEQHE